MESLVSLNPAFGLRAVLAFTTFAFFAGAAFLAGAAFFTGAFVAVFLATVFFAAGLAADFFAFGILKLLDILPVNHVDSTPYIVTLFPSQCKRLFI